LKGGDVAVSYSMKLDILRRWSKRTLIFVGALLLFLLVIRACLPYAVKRYVNHVLQGLKDYRGQVVEVDLHLWRGSYAIRGLTLEKKNGKSFAPFLSAPTVDFSVEWKALLHGSFVGEVIFLRPELNFVDSNNASQKQLGIDKSWGYQFEKLFPLEINRLEIRDGVMTFKNPTSNPPVDLRILSLQVLGRNFTNSTDTKEKYPAEVDITGRPLKKGDLKAHLEIAPIAKSPTFSLQLTLKSVSIVELNDFLQAYGGVDAESGNFEVYTEFTSEKGRVEGYVKPIIRNLSIFRLKDVEENPLQAFWEALLATVSFIFTNQSEVTVATKIPFSGTFDEPNPDWLALLGNLVKNAWFEALKPQLDKNPPPEVTVRPGKEEKNDLFDFFDEPPTKTPRAKEKR
jgi:hypothetical protein